MRSGLAVFLLVGLAVVLAGTAGVLAGDQGPPDPGPGDRHTLVSTGSDVHVDSALSERDGAVQVLVHLGGEGPRERLSVAELQTRAERSQDAFQQTVERTAGVTVETEFWLTNTVLVTVDTDHIEPGALAHVHGVERLTHNANVVRHRVDSHTSSTVSPAKAVSPAGGPETTYGLDQLNVTDVWTGSGTRGANTSVAVLDTGIDADHSDLDLTDWAEFDDSGNQVDSEPQDFDPNGHGTHTSGTVAGGNASGEYVGVAPETDLYHGAVLTNCTSTDCTGSFAQIIGGMEWAVENDVDVISMSLGAEGYHEELIDPVRTAQVAGPIVVASAGNDYEGTSSTPGNVYESIAVGATDDSGDISAFSSGETVQTALDWGTVAPSSWPDEYVVPTIAAPGQTVKSTLPGEDYGTKRGTSMAAPHVAGGIALVQAATDADLTAGEMEAALAATAWKPSGSDAPAGERDSRYGAGIVDLPAVIDLVETGVTAEFSVTPSDPAPDETVTLDANGSVGEIEHYEWAVGSGENESTATGPVLETTFPADGNYTVSLTVTGVGGKTDTETRTVQVRTPVIDDRWSVDLGGAVQTSPTVVNGTVVAGSSNGTVSAHDADTGETVWTSAANGSVRSSPTVVGETVYVGDTDGYLYALDLDTGERRWAVQTGDSVVSSPTVSDGTVFVGNDGGSFHALDAASGATEWAVMTDDSVGSSPTVAGGTVYVGSDDRSLYAFDRETGNTTWTYETGGAVYSSPTVAPVDGLGEAGGASNTVATDDSGDTASVGANDGDATVFVGSFDGALYALNATTGEKRWSFDTADQVWSSPTVANGTVYVGSDDTSVYAIDATTGEQAWAFETDDIVDSSPTVVDETVVVGGWDGTVYALAAANGTQRAAVTVDDAVIASSPTVVDGTIYVGTRDSHLNALDTQFEGSGEGSRSLLGTLGHHGAWADQAPTAGFVVGPSPPVYDEPLVLDASFSQGAIETFNWTLTGSSPTSEGSQSTVSTNESVLETTVEAPGTYEMSLTITNAANETRTSTRTVTVGLPPVASAVPQDPDGDGLYSDVRGDGGVTIFDIQTLFANLDSPAVQDHAEFYNFHGEDPDTVTIFDLQSLFRSL